MQRREAGKKRPHALLLPCAWQGHINPLMQLAQHLVACHGFQITFVNTYDNHARILQHSFGLAVPHSPASTHSHTSPYTSCRSSSYPEIELVGLSPVPADPVCPSPAQPDDHTLSLKDVTDYCVLLPFIPLIERLIGDINLSSNPLTCVIADPFLYWLPAIARAAHIPSLLAFYPASAASLALFCHAPSLLSSGVVNPDGSLGGCGELLTAIPGLPSIQSKDVSWIAGLQGDEITVMFDLVISIGKHLKDFDAILLNTYQELENEALDALVKSNLQVIPIGPLSLVETRDCMYNVACSSLWTTDKDCLQWLEGRLNSSVIYIAFGSLARFNVSNLHELALGIEASQLNFVWVLGPHWMDKRNELLPEGFLERTRDRALFLTWAPQSLMLSHPSIGVFVTHCGWNSTMEAISIGVPMLTWPYVADQPLNHHYITEEWNIGMPLNDHISVMQREGVKNVVLSIMVGNEGLKIRETIAKFNKKANLAVQKSCGKLFQNLQNVVAHIRSSTM